MISLVSLPRHIVFWNFYLALLLLYPIRVAMPCHHFHWFFRKSWISFFFLFWPSNHWVECCSFYMSMWVFCCFCFYWSLDLDYVDLIGCMELFQSSCIVQPWFLTNYMANFGEGAMGFWEEGIFFSFKVKCSVDIC